MLDFRDPECSSLKRYGYRSGPRQDLPNLEAIWRILEVNRRQKDIPPRIQMRISLSRLLIRAHARSALKNQLTEL